MERLTNGNLREEMANSKSIDAPWAVGVWMRLCEIEDILGQEYTLSRLRELVEADRENRISIWTPDEQRDIIKAVQVVVRGVIQWDTDLMARTKAAEERVDKLGEMIKREAENYHAGIELAESLRRSAEARAEKTERELEAVITAINNGYRIGAITIRDPKFILPGIKISGWYRTVKEE